MAVSKVLIFSIVISLAFLGSRADASIEDDVVEPGASDSAIRLELGQLRSKIATLGSENIASLQSEIESLQKKDVIDAEELVGKAHARAGELEKQIEKLENEIKTQYWKRDALEAGASAADKKVEELSLKLESLQKTNDEQKRRIKKTERALHVAEEELMKAQLEATLKKKELVEIHGAWLPLWLATHLDNCRALAAAHWNEHGKPAYNSFVQKVSHISAQAQKRVEPHLETAKTKWIPALKEQWVTFTTFVEPHAQLVGTKTVEVYEASVTTLRPHVVRVQEIVNPYFQDAKTFSKPYIDRVATITKPHVEKVRVVLKPYTKRVVYAYGKFLKSATTYHHQVQATVQEMLKKHELTKALATKELVWFAASAFLALPIFFLYSLFSSIFCKKPSKPTQSSHANHAPRRPRRRHAD